MPDRKQSTEATQRYRAWRSLVHLATQLAVAGLRKQGYSSAQAWAICRKRWIRSMREHQQANRLLARRLEARRGPARRAA